MQKIKKIKKKLSRKPKKVGPTEDEIREDKKNRMRSIAQKYSNNIDKFSLHLPNLIHECKGTVEYDLERLDEERKLYSREIPKHQMANLKWSLGAGTDRILGGSKFESELLTAWVHPEVSSDLKLIVNGKDRINGNQLQMIMLVHRVILCSYSGFFSRTLKRAGNKCNELVLDTVGDPFLFVVVVRWMYTGVLDLQKLGVTIERVFDMANRLWCNDLTRESHAILNRLFMDGQLERAFEKKENLEEFYRLRKEYDQFGNVEGYNRETTVYGNIKDLVVLEPESLKEMISDDNMVVTSEREVYFAVIRWFDVHPETRYHFLADLLNHVRFYNMEPTEMIDCIITRPDLFENKGPLQTELAKAFWIQTLIQYERPVDEGFNVRPSRAWDPVDIIQLRADAKLSKRYVFLSDYIGNDAAQEELNNMHKSANALLADQELNGEGNTYNANAEELDDFAYSVMKQMNERLITKKTSNASIVARWVEDTDSTNAVNEEKKGNAQEETTADEPTNLNSQERRKFLY